MKILRHTHDNVAFGNTCQSCYFINECPSGGICGTKPDGINDPHPYWHYANHKQIEALIAEAEAGYRWAKENGSWICRYTNECNVTGCCHEGPHGHHKNNACHEQCSINPEGICIPYRCELKENDVEQSNDVCQLDVKEYQVAKNMSLNIFAEDTENISSDDFRDIFLSEITVKFCKNFTLHIDDEYDLLQEHGNKLMSAGYIEPVNDPVVKVGDCFKDKRTEQLFKVCQHLDDLILVNIMQGYTCGVTTADNNKLSHFVGSHVKDFTPVTIEIKEV